MNSFMYMRLTSRDIGGKISLLHCISQKGSFWLISFVCSWSWLLAASLLGLPPSSKEPPAPAWGQIDCHLSAKVDTIGGRDGLLSSILSISLITVAFNFGMSWNWCSVHVTELFFFFFCVFPFFSYLQALKTFVQLLYVGRTEEKALNTFILEGPRDGQLSKRASQSFSESTHVPKFIRILAGLFFTRFILARVFLQIRSLKFF